MYFLQLFNELKEEFPEHIALGVCVACGIHHSTKLKKKDIAFAGNFEKRLEKKVRKTLWNNTEKDLEYIVRLSRCVYQWDIQKSHDLVKKKTFTQLLDDQK